MQSEPSPDNMFIPPREVSSSVKQNPPLTPTETGGYIGPEPTRYGDWEKQGRCIDF